MVTPTKQLSELPRVLDVDPDSKAQRDILPLSAAHLPAYRETRHRAHTLILSRHPLRPWEDSPRLLNVRVLSIPIHPLCPLRAKGSAAVTIDLRVAPAMVEHHCSPGRPNTTPAPSK